MSADDNKVNMCAIRNDVREAFPSMTAPVGPVFTCGAVDHTIKNPAFGSEGVKCYLCRGFKRDEDGSPRCVHARFLRVGSPWFCDNRDMRRDAAKRMADKLAHESTFATSQNWLLHEQEKEPSTWT